MSAGITEKLDDLIRKALREFWQCRGQALDCVEAQDDRYCYRVVSDRGLLLVKVPALGTFFDDIVQGLRVQRYVAEHGIATNAALPTLAGEPYEALDGYGIVVQPWVEGQAFRAHPDGLRALG